MRVLVLWADPRSANLGVQALASGMRVIAKRAWGENTLVDFQDFGPGASSIGFGGRSIVRDFYRRGGPIREKLSRYDVILDSGAGDSFSDLYGLKRLMILHYAHCAAARVHVPLMLGPQTIGPFSSHNARLVAEHSMSRAFVIFARDSYSKSYATQLGAVASASTDVVFALPVPSVETPDRDVVLNVSGLLWNGHGDVTSDRYRSAVVQTISELHSRGREVTLLAHVLDNPTSDNDVPAVMELASQLSGVEVFIPSDLNSARQMLAGARVVIGARMHACLNALSTGVPTIAWAYSRKFGPLLGDLGWPFLVDLRSSRDVVRETLAILDDHQTDLRESASKVRLVAESSLASTVIEMRDAMEVVAKERNELGAKRK